MPDLTANQTIDLKTEVQDGSASSGVFAVGKQITIKAPSQGGRTSRVENPGPEVWISVPRAVVQLAVDGIAVDPRGPYMTQIQTAVAYEGQDVTVMARLADAVGALIFKAGIDSITLNVFDLASPTREIAVHSEELDPAVVTFAQLQLDKGWKIDTDGYAMKHTVEGASLLLEGGHYYKMEYLVRTASAGLNPVVGAVKMLGLMSPKDQF